MKLSFKNTVYNLISVFVSSILGVVARIAMTKYFGEEILGVNATIVETVTLLTLMEFGIETSIVYKLYRPINENNEARISELFELIKNAYRIVGILILVAGVTILPFIGRIVNSSLSIKVIITAYCIQLVIISLNYFLGYYKLILNAYQKMYTYVSFSIVLTSAINIAQIIAIIYLKNYHVYLLISGLNTLILFAYTRRQVKKQYGFLFVKSSIKKTDIKEMFSDLKKIIYIQISGYIYGCTDNILLSSMFGAVLTGYISNYKLIVSILRRILTALYNGVNASWGAMLNSKKEEKDVFSYYMNFTFIEFVACMIMLVPTVLLIDLVIVAFFGNRFIIDPVIKYLIVFDAYGTFLHQPTGVFIHNLGLFDVERRISIIAAIVNIGASVFLSLLLGPRGVFVGTILAVLIYWILRSYFIDKNCFVSISKSYIVYWSKQLKYLVSFIITIFLCDRVMGIISIDNTFIRIIVLAVIFEIIILIWIIIFFGKSQEFTFVKKTLSSITLRK